MKDCDRTVEDCDGTGDYSVKTGNHWDGTVGGGVWDGTVGHHEGKRDIVMEQ